MTSFLLFNEYSFLPMIYSYISLYRMGSIPCSLFTECGECDMIPECILSTRTGFSPRPPMLSSVFNIDINCLACSMHVIFEVLISPFFIVHACWCSLILQVIKSMLAVRVCNLHSSTLLTFWHIDITITDQIKLQALT